MSASTGVYPGRLHPRPATTLRRRHAATTARGHMRRPESAHVDTSHQLFMLALQVRSFLEPVWLEWHAAGGADIPSPPSRTTCGRSSLFLKRVLKEHGIAAGGKPQGYFGFHAGQDWRSHAWVEAGSFIIDVTADQFGDEPVIVTTSPDPRYQKGVIDSAYPEFVRSSQRAIDRLWLRWLDYVRPLPSGRVFIG